MERGPAKSMVTLPRNRGMWSVHAGLLLAVLAAGSAVVRAQSDPAEVVSPRKIPESVPPRSLQAASAVDDVRAVIDEVLHDASKEERQIWYEQLKELPAGIVRDLLSVRREMRVPLGGFRVLPTPDEIEPPSEATTAPAELTLPESRQAIEQAVRWHAHNLANAHTPGFRRLRIFLVDRPRSEREAEGLGCELGPLTIDPRPGALQETGLPLDIAIEGPGWLPVLHDSGVCFTRSGSLGLNADGCLYLITAGPESCLKPALSLPLDASEVAISPVGQVSVSQVESKEPREVGKLQLAIFAAPGLLTPVGGGLYRPSEASGEPVYGEPGQPGFGRIRTGALERSNVNADEERARIAELRELLNQFESPKPDERPAKLRSIQPIRQSIPAENQPGPASRGNP